MTDFNSEDSRSPAHDWPGHDRDGYTPPPEPLTPEAPQVTEDIAVIVLPCSHLHVRPDGLRATITCHCGKVWVLEKDHGGRSWGARLVAHRG